MKRSITALAVIAGLAVTAPYASAGEAPADAVTSATTTASATATATEAASPAASADPTGAKDTSAPSTSTPATTSAPATTTPATTTPATTAPATTTTVPSTAPACTDCETPPCTTDCIPASEEVGCTDANCLPTAGGGTPPVRYAASLPFTGVEDMMAPLLLALVVLLGGVVAWRWAELRESVAQAATRARRTPALERGTGYDSAMRQYHIEQRARRMFMPKVA